MKHAVALLVLAFLLTACGSPSPQTLPTYTPLPTHTPQPTYTPYPTYTPPVVAPTVVSQPVATPLPITTPEAQPVANRCIVWALATAHVGEAICVRGTVSSTYGDAKSNAFFINFDSSRTSFYAVSFKHSWENLQGRCVEISGKIAPYNGRPQIVIEDKEQLTSCK